MIKKLISLSALLILVPLAAPYPALAADRDVPLVMWSVRDRLLQDRTRLLNQRAELSQRIVQTRSVQNEIDKLLCLDTLPRERYEELQSARSRILMAINDMQRRLDAVEKFLLDNNRDLANVEYHIQRYACLR